MKQSIIQYLHVLLSHNVIGKIQFTNRYNGFVGELDFKEWFRLNRRWEKIYNGGFLLPTVARSHTLDNPVYFTVSEDSPEEYGEIYKRIALLNCRAMFFIQWDDKIPFSDWGKSHVEGISEQLPVPNLSVYYFNTKDAAFLPSTLSDFRGHFTDRRTTLIDNVPNSVKARFNELLDRFDERAIMDLYVQRLIFDGYLGLTKERGIPSDIDQIITIKGGNQLIAFEVKEKDLSKTAPIGFGMDVLRIDFFTTFTNITGIEVYYIVKQINNQIDRKVIAWRAIKMGNFIANAESTVVEGGTGMRSQFSSNPTKICREKYFITLSSYA